MVPKIINNDIWNFWKGGDYIIIPTNGFVKNSGELVMGRGLAYHATQYIHDIQYILGDLVNKNGNIPFILDGCNIISFPVKYNWWEKADLKLIEKSAILLQDMIQFNPIYPIYCPKLGCGNGGLNWEQVFPIIDKYLLDYVILVDNNRGKE